jgi:ABC-type transport system involved in cytochrome bd biosynthesis fused ATPase/permease subunit
VTHNVNVLSQVDQVVVLNSGKIVETGTYQASKLN